jgi:DNA-binding response OmpR family regulator
MVADVTVSRRPTAEGSLTAMHLLVIEDDPRLSRLLKRLLEDDRHVVELATDGRTGLEIAEEAPGIECVILDVGLPDVSGLEVARRIRANGSDVTILMLTARDAVGDRVSGLDAGADDYLVKPFAFEELSARLRALARRGTPADGRRRTVPRLSAGAITLDETARRVTVSDRPVDLSPREFSLLECLLRHPGQTLSRDQLLDQAWPFGVAVTPNAVDAYVHYLRDKLGDAGRQIETVRGVGYRLAGD